jgi:hypothetical protein
MSSFKISRRGFLAAMLASSANAAQGVRGGGSPGDLPALPSISELQAIADKFHAMARTAGLDLSRPLPRIHIRNVPGVSVYHSERNEITFPSWSEAPAGLRADADRMASETGGKITGQQFFADEFRYFFAHELSHWLQTQLRPSRTLELKDLTDPYEFELQANRTAVAFWRAIPEERAWLDRVVQRFERVLSQRPNPVPEGASSRTFFNERYPSKLGSSYPLFQFRMVIDASHAPTSYTFDEAVRDLTRQTPQ